MLVLHDLRFACRLLRRNLSTTAIAVLSIALSVGATSVVFAAIKSVLIDLPPYAHPEELVQIRTEFGNFEPSQTDWAFWNDAQEIIRRTRTLQSVGIYGNAIFDLAGDESTPPEALYGLRVSASLFPALGVKPMLGRNILPEEDHPGNTNEMILSYGLWVRRFNADQNIVGRSVNIDGHDCLVIGVMPPGFNFPLRRAAAHTPSPYVEFWAPLQESPRTTAGALGVVARLRQGVSLSNAQQDLVSISAALSREFPATNRDHNLRVGLLLDRAVGSARKSLWLLMAAASLFLLIGCANVANLLLARGLVRQREISIRFAVGAGRGRIVGQFLTESSVLALLGGLGGYVLTAAAWKVLPAIAPLSIPRLEAARADWSVLGFALAVAIFNGLLFGMAPALRAGLTPASANGDFGVRGILTGRRDRLLASLVIAEVAITVALVVVGGQIMGRFIELLRTDPGFQADHLLASVVLPSPDRYRTPEQRGLIYRRFVDAVRALPGVESVGTVDALPFSGENHGGLIASTAAQVMQPNTQVPAEVDIVSADYLQTLGVRLLEGRWLREDEMKTSSETVLMNDIAAAKFWPGTSAIGKQICIYCTPENPRNWKRVVGVVTSVRHAAVDEHRPFSLYLAEGAMEHAQFLVVKTAQPADSLEKAVRIAIAGVDPNQPVFLSVSMRSLIADSLADRRFIASLLAATALLALLMSAAGVYGVVSYTISRRTLEIGVRMALGATRNHVQFLVFRQGFFAVAVGLTIGLAVTMGLMSVLRRVVAGLGSAHWSQIFVSVSIVSFAAAIACWVPARRATKIDPMSALRSE
ncbi:MAG: ABC transporter permease [Terriglobales bacterium]